MSDFKKPRKRNYVNNPDLLEALISYKKQREDAKTKNKEIPKVPDYIGKAIYDIAHRLSSKPNFYSYSYKDDMIMDGIEDCIKYIHNFDENKSSNPFAYFTQIIWYAFLRRIAKEKKQLYVKLASSQEMMHTGRTSSNEGDILSNMSLNVDYVNDYIDEYEKKNGVKKKK